MEQRTPEWHAARLGKVTASRLSDALARTKSGWGSGRANYMAELIAERLTGQPAERFMSAAMQRGTDTEAQARAAYAFECDFDVTEVGFIDHPVIPMSGASPDGLVGDVGLVEIKCPNTATHIDTLIGGVVPSKYELQILWQMACTGRTWCDFVSFDPRLPPEMRLFIRRFHADHERIRHLETEVRDFLNELEAKMSALVSSAVRQEAQSLDGFEITEGKVAV